MGSVRPLERDELPEIVALHERVVGGAGGAVPPRLLEHFQSIFFDNPAVEPDLPPLAYVDGSGGIAGFIGSSARRFVWNGRPVRMRVSSHLLTEPRVRAEAAGVRLVRELLSGPQDFAVTDTSNVPSQRIWERLGGATVYLNCVGWVRLFKPAHFGRAVAASRGRRVLAGAALPLAAPVDFLATKVARSLRPAAAEAATTTDLTPAELAEHSASIPDSFELHAEYGEDFVQWLFDALGAIAGPECLIARVVRRDGEVKGWYLYLLKPDSVAETLQIVATDGDVGAVLDHLLQDAGARGASGIKGRVQAHVAEWLHDRHCHIHPSSFRVLVHAKDPLLVDSVQGGRALLTRLDADWVYGAWWDVHGGTPLGASP